MHKKWDELHVNICYPWLWVFIAAINIEDDFTSPALTPAGNKRQHMTVGV